MIFVSYWFIAFALAFFPLYCLVRDWRLRLAVLAVGSVLFHGHFAGAAGVVPIIALALATYLAGLSRRRWLCVAAMLLSVAALILYKYTKFLSESIGSLAPAAGEVITTYVQPLLPATPPLAISFFVFEFVHYLFEVLHKGSSIRNPLHFGLFALFWPSLVAGPIKRYQQFIPSLMDGVKSASSTDARAGLLLITFGLLKKIMADNLTIWIQYHETRIETLDMPSRWLFFVYIALRIYWDFSGYSDMAIGFARIMGIQLPPNFRNPYLARNISDFWGRWHISLSSWIRDYVYIPLGGNRYGVPRRIMNGLIAFAICGLWHGAAWNFVLWGLYHGAGLAVQSTYPRLLGPPGRAVSAGFGRLPVLSWLATFLFVSIGWLLFFYPVPTALNIASLLFGGS
jgi:alginate O-acetyltransferase complex protein AlgI